MVILSLTVNFCLFITRYRGEETAKEIHQRNIIEEQNRMHGFRDIY